MPSIRNLLKDLPVTASAPCRVDSGGTWDIKALALPMEPLEPVTLNVALNLRTRVSLAPFKEGWVRISSEGFSHPQEFPQEKLPFQAPFGLYFAAVSHFEFQGLHIHIRSDSPVKSALGGSSTALIALLKALSKLSTHLGGRPLSARQLLHLGYHLEDAVSGGHCGMQDQAAAVYGGVNRWIWHYGTQNAPFKRDPLLDSRGQKELSSCLLVAYSGKSHASLGINRSWIGDFLSGKTRQGWAEVNAIVHALAEAIRGKEWSEGASLLREEMALRRVITPDALIPLTEKLVKQAEEAGCGARFAGAGGGGSVWALGEADRISRLRKAWERTLAPVRGGRVLECAVDGAGAR